MASLRLGETIASERLRPSSASSSTRASSMFTGGRPNGAVDAGLHDVSSMSGLHRAVLYVFGEKTQMKVSVNHFSLSLSHYGVDNFFTSLMKSIVLKRFVVRIELVFSSMDIISFKCT